MRIFDIQRFCLDDGPGIRTAVFLKGCNQACPWCHNPESISSGTELFYTASLCKGCGLCMRVCPNEAVEAVGNAGIAIDRAKCGLCFACVDACPAGAYRAIGRDVTPGEVRDIVMKDKKYYDVSGGGVTFSGGEPTFQSAFLEECLALLKAEGLHTAIETNGSCEWEVFERLARLIDYYMIDLKHIDDSKHRQVIGASNERTLYAIRQLARLREVEVRVPVIPGFNDSASELYGIIDFCRDAGIRKIKLLPYHKYGTGKYMCLFKEYPFASAEELTAEQVKSLIGGFNFTDLMIDVNS